MFGKVAGGIGWECSLRFRLDTHAPESGPKQYCWLNECEDAVSVEMQSESSGSVE